MEALNWTPFHARLHQRLKVPLLDSRAGQRAAGQRAGASAGPVYLLPKGQRILMAVSGGQDSLALVGLLKVLQPQWGWQLAIAHCNHRWRPGEDAAAEQVAQLAERLALPFFLRIAEVPPQGEGGARDWRYAMLGQIAQVEGFDIVVTGHTASDRAETLLYNLARGSGLDGLAALGWQRPLVGSAQGSSLQLVRPLLDFTRAETAEICAALSLPLWQDPVNQDLTYARNRMRHRVLPQLTEQINPRAVEHLAQTAELLEADVQYLERQAQTLRQQAETSIGLNRRLLKDAPLALQRRAVRQFLQRLLPQQPNAAQIEKFVLLFQAPQGSQSDPFPGGAIARVEGDWVRLEIVG